ncbi:MAG: 2-hydroxychromene-2-carboxylate isomerase [Burkholderiales bacterium]|jgi:2-hydroxychromene-2-carboxylate isomerase|nr:2-hydroxychromene-2-carboxylate isomerase [Burkholderiales bacterium]
MTKTVEFIFDFGSPNAYLVHKIVPAVEQRTGARFTYVPCLLGGIFKATGNQSPMSAFAGVKNKLQYEERERDRFVAKHRLGAFRWNPHFPVNTLTIMRGAIAAEMDGELARYVDVMFRGMWEEARKLDDPAVILETLASAGFDAKRYQQRVQDPDVKDKLVANTSHAVERGAFGSPTFFIGGEMWFGKERLRDIEEFLLAG